MFGVLVVFPPIVVDTKVIYSWNFVAPLIAKFGYRNVATNFHIKKC